ncbi:HEAT repeat domain-containing protein [Candidatus Poribacteria bacterium]|nr:HEAT repeat domain-containing protein [Candidatus Poribacteria bacterium]
MKYGIWILCLVIVAGCETRPDAVKTLEKLRTADWDIWREAGYDLALMGDNTVPFLIQTLTNESREARWHACYFLRNSYPDSRALPTLTEVFLHDTDEYVRSTAAYAIADIDTAYARTLMIQAVDTEANEITQNIAVEVLSHLGDKRVIPMLVTRLGTPETRMDAAFALGAFKDKRAIPILLNILDEKALDRSFREKAVAALARIGDPQTLPILVNLIDSRFADNVVMELPQFGASVVAPLLEKFARNASPEIRASIARVLRNIHVPELAPLYGQIYLETDAYELQDAISYALQNMGAEGFKSLVKVAKQKTDQRALGTLSTYNSEAAVDVVATLALDKSYPIRLIAIETLGRFGQLWKAQISTYLPRLLADEDPMVQLNTLNLIKQLKIVEMRPALQKLTGTMNQNIANAAHTVLAVLSSGAAPLKLEIETEQPRYNYGERIALSYRITNISTHTIKISPVPEILFLDRVEIRQPDGTLVRFRGPQVNSAPPRAADYHTLKAGSTLTHTVSLSTFHWLDQVGRYTIQPSTHIWADGLRFGFMAWTGILTGPEVHFDIESPSVDEVNRMLALMEAELEKEEHRIEAFRILHQLGELRLTKAIPLLKKLASDPKRNSALRESALNALAKFTAPNLTPFWIQMLNRSHISQTLAMKALSANGDARAHEPLRRIAFREGSDTAALALQQLGDDSAVEWLTALAQRKLRHWNGKQRKKGAVTLRRLQPSNTQMQRQNVLTDPLFYVNNYTPSLISDWEAIADEAATHPGLKTLLAHAHPMIQHAAAYELTYLGDASGIHLITPDLNANDVQTRMEAREALLRVNTQ